MAAESQTTARIPRRLLDAVHGEPPVQGQAAHAGARVGHVLRDAGRPEDPRRRRRPVVRQRRPRPQGNHAGRRASSSRSWTTRRRSRWATRRVRARERAGADRARRARSRVLHELGLGVRRHRAQDRAGVPPREGRRRAHALVRPRARLSRRGLRRHQRRRHGRESQGVAAADDSGRRSPRAHARSSSATRSRAACRRTAPSSPTISSAWWRCTMRRPSPRSSSSRSPAPPAWCCRRRAICKRLREICDKHGILLIFDEVITGFGRTGSAFAAQEFGVTPDIITCAKGLTNGCVPMGAVLASKKIYDAFMQGPPDAIELFHGYTYSAHPTACAAGLATLDYLPARRSADAREADRRRCSRRRCTSCAGCRTSSTSATTAWSRRIELEPIAGHARRARVRRVPQVLRARPADPHDRRHHRAVTGADHRAEAHRRAVRRCCRRPCATARKWGHPSFPCHKRECTFGKTNHRRL